MGGLPRPPSEVLEDLAEDVLAAAEELGVADGSLARVRLTLDDPLPEVASESGVFQVARGVSGQA